MSIPEGFRRALEIIVSCQLDKDGLCVDPGGPTCCNDSKTKGGENMANGFSRAQANALTRFLAIQDAEPQDMELVELVKENGSVSFGVELDGVLVAVILSKDDPASDYDVRTLGTGDDA